jgi:hypothetical protein
LELELLESLAHSPTRPLARSPLTLARFQQFDSTRSGALSSQDLQRLLAKDSMMDAREDCVKMVRAESCGEVSSEFADNCIAHEWV